MTIRFLESGHNRKIAGISFVVGIAVGALALLMLQQVRLSISWPHTPHEFIYFFGFLLLTIPAIALMGTTAAAIYAGLKSSREMEGSTVTDKSLDPHGLIDAVGSAPRWLILAFLGALLLLLGSLLDGYRFADGGFVKP